MGRANQQLRGPLFRPVRDLGRTGTQFPAQRPTVLPPQRILAERPAGRNRTVAPIGISVARRDGLLPARQRPQLDQTFRSISESDVRRRTSASSSAGSANTVGTGTHTTRTVIRDGFRLPFTATAGLTSGPMRRTVGPRPNLRARSYAPRTLRVRKCRATVPPFRRDIRFGRSGLRAPTGAAPPNTVRGTKNPSPDVARATLRGETTTAAATERRIGRKRSIKRKITKVIAADPTLRPQHSAPDGKSAGCRCRKDSETAPGRIRARPR